MAPLVSCILATRDRPEFCVQALRCYDAQDYRRREIVVVDDGVTPVETLCTGIPNLVYIRSREPVPTGEKLNIGIAASRGDVLQKIDDDDFYGPQFLSTAARHLAANRADDALVAWCCFAVLIVGEPMLYFSGHGWHAGGTLCFRRSLWNRCGFRAVFASEDSWFIRDHRPSITRVCAPDQYLVVRHGRNTWQRIRGYDSAEQYFQRQTFPKSLGDVV